MLKMVDHGKSDFYVVFAVILCDLKFLCLVGYGAKIHRLVSIGFNKCKSSI